MTVTCHKTLSFQLGFGPSMRRAESTHPHGGDGFDGSVSQADRLTPGSVSRDLSLLLFVSLPLGLWHAREREPAEEGRERNEDEVGVAAKRAEDERERGRHYRVGYTLEDAGSNRPPTLPRR